MRGPTGGCAHLARATALAVAVGGLGAGAHVAGGGAPPSGSVLAVVLLLTLWACAWATRFRLSPAAVLGLLAAGQVALHEAFGTLAAGGCLPAAAAHEHVPHAAHGCAATVVHAPSAGPGAVMLLAHVLATLVTAAVVGAGERAVWGLWAWLTRRVPAAAPRPVPVAARPPRAARGRTAHPARRVLLRVSPRRGPPAAALAL